MATPVTRSFRDLLACAYAPPKLKPRLLTFDGDFDIAQPLALN
jgi:hypothetical protein